MRAQGGLQQCGPLASRMRTSNPTDENKRTPTLFYDKQKDTHFVNIKPRWRSGVE